MRVKLTIATICLAGVAGAWIDTGHMVVAAVARDGLTSAARAQIQALLAEDPDPRTNTLAMSSCWADDTKTRETGLWHYHDIFFRTDGKPPLNKVEGESALTAMSRFTQVLGDGGASVVARREALKYIVHIVGDLHQPLHSVARETDALPKGDRGGNDFKVISPAEWEPAPRSLHFLWDMGAGAFMPTPRPLEPSGESKIDGIAAELRRIFPPGLFPQTAELDPKKWTQEGLKLSQELVYSLPESSRPSQVYLSVAQATSLRQATLGGYRLAALLNKLLR